MADLEQVGFRCTECGRMEAQSNQPCTEHSDVEAVYRLAEAKRPALWSIRCLNCETHMWDRGSDRQDAVRRLQDHRKDFPGHDVRLISIPQD